VTFLKRTSALLIETSFMHASKRPTKTPLT